MGAEGPHETQPYRVYPKGLGTPNLGYLGKVEGGLDFRGGICGGQHPAGVREHPWVLQPLAAPSPMERTPHPEADGSPKFGVWGANFEGPSFFWGGGGEQHPSGVGGHPWVLQDPIAPSPIGHTSKGLGTPNLGYLG